MDAKGLIVRQGGISVEKRMGSVGSSNVANARGNGGQVVLFGNVLGQWGCQCVGNMAGVGTIVEDMGKVAIDVLRAHEVSVLAAVRWCDGLTSKRSHRREATSSLK